MNIFHRFFHVPESEGNRQKENIKKEKRRDKVISEEDRDKREKQREGKQKEGREKDKVLINYHIINNLNFCYIA